MVKEIHEIKADKAVILGNHDAWRSFSEKKISKPLLESLAILQEDHLAYAVREWPEAGLSIVGARPFSWGGRDLRSPQVYGELYNVHTPEQSAARIVAAAKQAQHRDILILAHNGPTGLSIEPHDIWGKDFGRAPRGDWGDQDLQSAIEQIKGLGKRVPCVIAGHMHHKILKPRGALRTRFIRHHGTLYVNSAVVPRLRNMDDGVEAGYFLRVSCAGGKVKSVEELWIDAAGHCKQTFVPRILEQEAAS